ncbi:ATP-binding cassette domain-containing protein [Sutcliffiella sp. NPDC057660]|uniref:ATP-binding cassette domain-containing protein n=1 Tax=Sutcliffiella sp. NPDC057660 TaxID=3346199 RepID=UPI0036CDA754
MDTIKIENVSKKFGRKQALNNINLDINGAYGLLGPNGAGKTTLIRILATLIKPTTGRIYTSSVCWKSPSQVRDNLGYLPQYFSMYKNVTVSDALYHFANLKNIKKDKQNTSISQILNEVNLYIDRNQKIKNLSGGMIRRLGIAQALLGNPSILIVDEPTTGLDIEERTRFRELLRNIGENRTIVISSHIVEDIEEVCDSICIIKHGEILLSGEISKIKSSFLGKIYEKIETKEHFQESLRLDEDVISVKSQKSGINVVRYFSESKNKEGSIVEPSIEDIYIYTTKRRKN